MPHQGCFPADQGHLDAVVGAALRDQVLSRGYAGLTSANNDNAHLPGRAQVKGARREEMSDAGAAE